MILQYTCTHMHKIDVFFILTIFTIFLSYVDTGMAREDSLQEVGPRSKAPLRPSL